MSKKIIICADDFGLSDNVNKGILHLLEKKIINATSCMSNMPALKYGITNLKNIYNDSIHVGIHLNLTEGTPFTKATSISKNKEFLPLSKLLAKSKLRLIKYSDVYNELKAQIDNFIGLWGDLPDFIDGHQHVHHFPIIRKVVINLYKDFDMFKKQTYIRSTLNMDKSDFKSLIIYRSGAKKFNNLLVDNNIKHNTSFSGIYSLESNKADFREIILKAYKEIKDGGIIMCHPAIDIDEKDPIAKSRINEFKYFQSQQAIKDQKDNNIKL
ncbi:MULTISPECIES: ChbG/HpnK family deacetylase [unclassified Francisella]|uniref:ChbG/HpnK family deacetylase n=1 Tax=unclassified Francisella TaxID=2610885 RepID=UPI002E2FD5A9|nr:MULTISPECIES: ChbG/HpnK family deacetylase [unclassified Francisella]MED7818558.1 ChbG/HpnK family deacetylase [Francisella sp. 19S2-4]MED7829394.1 ChbG/HpnK family deacetylase [Francisella sp. 19S2-10]